MTQLLTVWRADRAKLTRTPDVEEATGRSQWEAPGYNHSGGGGGKDDRGHGSAPSGYPPSGYGTGHGDYRDGHKEKDEEKKKKSGKGGVLLGAAGGLAVGAVAGAVIAHKLREPHCSPWSHT